MEKILVVNGESYWHEYLPGREVVQKKIQSTEWLLKNNTLYVVDKDGAYVPDKILWRVGAIRPEARHRTILELIQLSGVPCINTAQVLMQGYDRLTMLGVLKKCGLPVIPFNVVTSSVQLQNIALPFPFVVKAGNYHGGFGKALIDSEEKWQDIKDLLFVSEAYVTTEPYINYNRDLRYLAVGDQVWAMARRGKFWKANVATTDFVLTESDEALVAHVKTLQQYLAADIVAIDVLEDTAENYYIVEYNDIPGLSGFPDAVKEALAQAVLKAAR